MDEAEENNETVKFCSNYAVVENSAFSVVTTSKVVSEASRNTKEVLCPQLNMSKASDPRSWLDLISPSAYWSSCTNYVVKVVWKMILHFFVE